MECWVELWLECLAVEKKEVVELEEQQTDCEKRLADESEQDAKELEVVGNLLEE